ncbi:MAG: ABC-F family ATP-binding cassette domain-containing protein, partial [Bacteroidales bacterium]|nr:ABC-F family ATP-binding cassette domain-containing protein [Bacteroidales bacterium]
DQIAVGDIRPKIRNILGSFLFDEDDIEKKVKVLSGGEKARLALAKLLLTPCNLLVLDEPTNHLDMNSKDILKNALLQYTGTLIVVSHDHDFLQGLTDSLFEFRNKSIKEFKGDIFEFLEYRKIENLKALELQKKASPDKGNATVSQNKLHYEQSKQRERDLRKLRSAVEKIEKEIESTEMVIAEKDELLSSNPELTVSDPNFYSEYEALKQKLDTLMEDWEKATEDLENF